ncbi:thioesterase II family protein [Phytohabitans rumicis]|uniref:Thioesterase n=1 Tax=Phytohabitans rumicis TaxID=1076125 RepID=A0A6V8LAL6_9ACTN|nr:alpha/beta fold hydrolase [Phytohabitans rumicis]GFJ94253.1 thioesterase [Phytohabitans rumicis]
MSDPLYRVFRPLVTPSVRLVCFPHAGGTATFFRTWADGLPGVEVMALRYAGRQDRLGDPFPASLAALADEVAESLTARLDAPLAFFGHSMGALLAFEVGTRLETRHGTSPVRLFVSGRPAPHRAEPTELHLADEAGLLAEVARLGNPDPLVFADPDLRALVLPALRDDYRLLETHRFAHSRVRATVVAYGGDRDPACGVRALPAWAELTTGGFAQRVFPGDHFYLVPCEPALVADVGERLRAALNEHASKPAAQRVESQ